MSELTNPDGNINLPPEPTPPPAYQAALPQPRTLVSLLREKFWDIRIDPNDPAIIQIQVAGVSVYTLIELSERDDTIVFYSRPTWMAWFVVIFSGATPWIAALLTFWVLKRCADRPAGAITEIRKIRQRWKEGVFE